MSKKLYVKILTLALVSVMVFAGASIMAGATGAEDNLLYHNTFDTDPTWSGWTHQATGGTPASEEDAEGSACLASTATSSENKLILSNLTPGKVLEITLKVKFAAGETVKLRAYPRINGNAIPSGYHASGEANSASAENNWTTIALRVPLVENANSLRLTMTGEGKGVLVDDLTVRYAEDKNLLINGNFETKDELNADKPFMWKTSGTVASDGNNGYCLYLPTESSSKYVSAYLPNIYSVQGTVYKLSFRYKRADGISGNPRIHLGNDRGGAHGFGFNNTLTYSEDGWGTCTAYISCLESNGVTLSFYIQANNAAGYFDDLFLEIIDTPVAANLFTKSSLKDISKTAYHDIYVTEATLSTMPEPGEECKLLVNVWDKNISAIGATSTKTVLAAIYKTSEARKQLCSIALADATSELVNILNNDAETFERRVAKPGTAEITLTMPSEAGTYTIEVCVWDSVSGLTPFASKTVVLSGTNTAVEES